jgi:hypothetical protein
VTTDQLMTILSGPPSMRNGTYRSPIPRDGVTCADGFKVSIQASEYHYHASIHDRHNEGGYDAFELGFPSEPDDLISKYAEDGDKLTETVYGYVPFDVVRKLIEKHGGPGTVCESLNLGALSEPSPRGGEDV